MISDPILIKGLLNLSYKKDPLRWWWYLYVFAASWEWL